MTAFARIGKGDGVNGLVAVNLAIYALTALLAVWPRRMWPVVTLLLVCLAVNVLGRFIAVEGDPRAAWTMLLMPSIVQAAIFVLGRGGVMAARESDPRLLYVGWQVFGLATFVRLSFFDDYTYTWWNWIVVVPINLFLAAQVCTANTLATSFR